MPITPHLGQQIPLKSRTIIASFQPNIFLRLLYIQTELVIISVRRQHNAEYYQSTPALSTRWKKKKSASPTISTENWPSKLMSRARALHPLFRSCFLQTTRNNTFASLTMTQAKNQVIYAPSNEAPRGVKSIFLAGTTSKVDNYDWRERLSTAISDMSVTVYNPYRPDWDSSWREEIDFAPYREQVEWELEKQEKADIVVIYFHPATQAPISLLEFGLCARVPGKAIIVCPEGYWKRGNVQITCKKYGIEMVNDDDGLREAVVKRLLASCDSLARASEGRN